MLEELEQLLGKDEGQLRLGPLGGWGLSVVEQRRGSFL